MITNIHKNSMGTASFNGKFGKMRKEQDFIVYPIKDSGSRLDIQSEHRFGIIYIDSRTLWMSANHAQYATPTSLQADLMAKKAEKVEIPADELETLLAFIRSTASPMAGNNDMHVFCDNSGAANI
jgi:hypothetical protein